MAYTLPESKQNIRAFLEALHTNRIAALGNITGGASSDGWVRQASGGRTLMIYSKDNSSTGTIYKDFRIVYQLDINPDGTARPLLDGYVLGEIRIEDVLISGRALLKEETHKPMLTSLLVTCGEALPTPWTRVPGSRDGYGNEKYAQVVPNKNEPGFGIELLEKLVLS
ncbi:MAG: hypothetical protein NTX24_02245 [Candidatus Pacearchaeota archaeon]|nr:hypothetical protein [Candidatus Pacearchaeota archaeon]